MRLVPNIALWSIPKIRSMTKQHKYSVRIFIEIYSGDKKWEWLSNKLKIMWKSNITVQVAVAGTQVEKFINLIVGGCSCAKRWVNSKLIEYITFLLQNVSVSWETWINMIWNVNGQSFLYTILTMISEYWRTVKKFFLV